MQAGESKAAWMVERWGREVCDDGDVGRSIDCCAGHREFGSSGLLGIDNARKSLTVSIPGVGTPSLM
jgi:hypothetical protein